LNTSQQHNRLSASFQVPLQPFTRIFFFSIELSVEKEKPSNLPEPIRQKFFEKNQVKGPSFFN